jgi:hypothetical protein
MRKKLGEILVASGVVTQSDLDVALGDQTAGEPSRVGDLLVALGKITPVQLARALSLQHAIPFIQLPPVPTDVLKVIPIDFQQQHRLVPFRVTGDAISIAVADPSNIDAIEELRGQLNKKVNRYVAAGDEIDAIHTGAMGVASLDMPSIAPAVAPVSRGPSAQDLFGSLDLDASSPSSLGDELFSGIDLPPPNVADLPPPPPIAPVAKSSRRQEEEEPEFFEATPVAKPASAQPPPPPGFELDGVPIENAAEGLTSSSSGTFDLTSAIGEEVPPASFEPSGSFDVAMTDSGDFGAAPAAPPPPPPASLGAVEPFDYPFTDSGNFASAGPASAPSGSFEVALPEVASADTAGPFDFAPPPLAAAESGSFEIALTENSGDFGAAPSAVDDFFAVAPPPSIPAPPSSEPAGLGSGAFSTVEEEPLSLEELPPEPEPGAADALFGSPEPLDDSFFEEAPAEPSESVVVDLEASGPTAPPAPFDFPPPPPAANEVPPAAERAALAVPEPFPELEAAPPEAPPPPAPPTSSMPSWLGADAGVPAEAAAPALVLTPGEWTGRLDDVPPSRLIVGAVKALVTKGLLTEAEILEALGKKS